MFSDTLQAIQNCKFHCKNIVVLTATVFAAALLVSACTIPGIRWFDSDISGPPLASGQPTKQVRRCDVVTSQSPWASTGHFNKCDVGFRSIDGSHVDAFAVQREISASLPHAKELQPLLAEFRSTKLGSSKTKQDYWLYLVAVNPVVVIGVPRKPIDPYCSSPGWTKCFTVTDPFKGGNKYDRLTSFDVRFNTSPPITEGAFVLVPEWQIVSTPLTIDKLEVTIKENGLALSIMQRDNTWRISSSKFKP
jgi:hypothetical protein